MYITVFTPTYNRAYVLNEAFESLLKQTRKDFEWVIMDDGSTDNTRELVESWKKIADFNIIYDYQVNQGRFAAFNNAQKYFKGELVAPLDSDDKFKENCIERLIETWESLGEKQDDYSGILAYMETQDGEILGTGFPDNLESAPLFLLPDKYHVSGDKLQVCRTDLICKYKYPVFEGEKFGGDNILYFKINEEYPEFLLREKLAIREYLPDSITNNLLQHHLKSKNGIREHYKDCIEHEFYDKKRIVKHTVGYIAYSKLTDVSFIDIIKLSPKKIETVFLYFGGIAYYLILKGKEKRMERGQE